MILETVINFYLGLLFNLNIFMNNNNNNNNNNKQTWYVKNYVHMPRAHIRFQYVTNDMIHSFHKFQSALHHKE
jgi:hypothetical protein